MMKYAIGITLIIVLARDSKRFCLQTIKPLNFNQGARSIIFFLPLSYFCSIHQ